MSTVTEKTCFEVWCTPEKNTYDHLNSRTTAARTIYDRDVKQITRVFSKPVGGGSPTDYSISIGDLDETIALTAALITDLEEKLEEFRTQCSNVMFTIDRWTARVYSLLQKGGSIVGISGLGLRLAQSQSSETTYCPGDPPPQTSAIATIAPAAGWLGLTLTCSAIGLAWVKDYVEEQKKEQGKFQALLEENHRMKAAHDASIIMLNALQKDFDETMAKREDAVGPPGALPNSLVQLENAERLHEKIRTEILQEMRQRKGFQMPPHLEQACSPLGIRHALLTRGPSSLALTRGSSNSPSTPPVSTEIRRGSTALTPQGASSLSPLPEGKERSTTPILPRTSEERTVQFHVGDSSI